MATMEASQDSQLFIVTYLFSSQCLEFRGKSPLGAEAGASCLNNVGDLHFRHPPRDLCLVERILQREEESRGAAAK